MARVKPVTLYAQAESWVKSDAFKGKEGRDKPVIFMDEEGYESYCKPQFVGRNAVKLNHWYKIERVPAREQYSFFGTVQRIVPNSHLTPEQYSALPEYDAKQSGSKQILPPPVPTLDDDILKLLKRHIALRNTDIYEMLSGNTKRESDFTKEERQKYKEIGTATKRMHNNAKLFRLSVSRDGRQNNASHVFYGLDADSVLSKIEYRGHLKLVKDQEPKKEPIHSLKGSKWEKLGG